MTSVRVTAYGGHGYFVGQLQVAQFNDVLCSSGFGWSVRAFYERVQF